MISNFILEPQVVPLTTGKSTIKGQIVRVKSHQIIIEIHYDRFEFVQKWHQFEFYNISFELNRTPYEAQHYALDHIEKHNLFKILIENDQYECEAHNLEPLRSDFKLR